MPVLAVTSDDSGHLCLHVCTTSARTERAKWDLCYCWLAIDEKGSAPWAAHIRPNRGIIRHLLARARVHVICDQKLDSSWRAKAYTANNTAMCVGKTAGGNPAREDGLCAAGCQLDSKPGMQRQNPTDLRIARAKSDV